MPGENKYFIDTSYLIRSLQELVSGGEGISLDRFQTNIFGSFRNLCYFDGWLQYMQTVNRDPVMDIDEIEREKTEPWNRNLLHYNGEKIDEYALIQYDWLNYNLHNIKQWAHSSLNLLEAQGSFYQLYPADYSTAEVCNI